MLIDTIALKTRTDGKLWFIRCNNCGKFISREQIENKEAKFHFIPDNQFSPEESYWIHIKC